jgi:hypothetical protein
MNLKREFYWKILPQKCLSTVCQDSLTSSPGSHFVLCGYKKNRAKGCALAASLSNDWWGSGGYYVKTGHDHFFPHTSNTRPLWALHYLEVKKSCPATRHEGAWGERKYSSYSFLTSARGWVVSVTLRPRFTPGERTPRYPLDRRLGGPQSRCGRRG